MVVAVFSDRSTMWPKTRRGGCKCISVFALASGHFGIAKVLQQRLLRATPQELAWLASLPCVLHQTPFLPVKNNGATVPPSPRVAFQGKPWAWVCSSVGVRRKKRVPRAGISYLTPSESPFAASLSFLSRSVGEKELGLPGKGLHSGNGFKGSPGKRLMKW